MEKTICYNWFTYPEAAHGGPEHMTSIRGEYNPWTRIRVQALQSLYKKGRQCVLRNIVICPESSSEDPWCTRLGAAPSYPLERVGPL